MTKREIKAILKELIKTEIKFKDPADKKYYLDLLKEGDLDEFFSQFEVAEIVNVEVFDTINDLREEYEAL